MRPLLKIALSCFGLTLLLFAVLFTLFTASVDPVQLVRDTSAPEFLRHGRPTLSFLGIVVWAAVFLGYSVLVPRLVLRSRDQRVPWGYSVTLAVLLCSATLLFHPLLLAVVLPEGARPSLYFILERVPVLERVHLHWGLASQWPWAFALVWLTTSIVMVLGRKRLTR